MIQRYGTGVVGLLFGPVCLVWFASIGVVGGWNIAKAPQVLEALNPIHALRFVTSHGVASFVVLGSVLLCVTGAEALYADMGHFGKRAIRLAWFAVAAPALTLNYFGQGALLMTNPRAVDNPFFLAYPDWALYPMVGLATAATVIASQATISGAYSMTQQAIQLGYLPRMSIRHTSAKRIGQIYVPVVNWILLAIVLRSGRGVRIVVRTRIGIRRGRDGHDAGHHVPHLLRRALRLALSTLAVRHVHGFLHGGGLHLLCRGDAQGLRWRLVPARHGAPRSSY